MTHPGQQLSALIDGELEASKRESVLVHTSRCPSCRDELAALYALKRRTSAAFRENPAAVGLTGLTGRLIGISDLLGLDGSAWPPPPPPGGWGTHGVSSQAATAANRDNGPDHRATRFFLATSVTIFLAGLGTAAVIAGGEPQARAPAPPVTPSIDVLVAPHNAVNSGLTGGGSGSDVFAPRSRGQWSFPDVDAKSVPGQP
jgi:Putative zinc-finger